MYVLYSVYILVYMYDTCAGRGATQLLVYIYIYFFLVYVLYSVYILVYMHDTCAGRGQRGGGCESAAGDRG